jgi:hypothetical protein
MSVETEAQTLDPQAAEMREDPGYSNIDSDNSYDGQGAYQIPNYPTKDNVRELAFAFEPKADCLFAGLDVAVNRGEEATKADAFLTEDDNGKPGPILYAAAMDVPKDGGLASASVGPQDSPVRLLAKTTYWLTLRSALPNSNLGWYYNSTSKSGPAKVKLGDSWGPTTSNVQGAFRISGSPI